ncbi:MAG TPA: GAF domain-containing protein [Thermomicrobiales bacterium]|nr:GAF domain-containing protein [Thermomicrobiales bacterium]HQZ90371.1 GAF domain-containing protein [Thermomicrobiales bacterium]HRA31430.1 GAF domain-containing protein [Thermomicrobiales bacterium]
MDLDHPSHPQSFSLDYRAIADPARLDVVASTGLLGTVGEAALDEIVQGMTREGIAPICAIIIVDAYRMVFTSSVGLPEPWRTLHEAPLARSRSLLVVASGQPVIIDGARDSPRDVAPMAMVDRGISAWLGMPLLGTGYQVVGVLALMDERPRCWLPSARRLADIGAARANVAIQQRIARRRAAQSRPAE